MGVYSICCNHASSELSKITITESKTISKATRKTYEIPRSLFSWHSSYFAAALDPGSSFKNNKHGELVLEESIAVFDAFHCWLYTGRLKDPPSDTKHAMKQDIYLPAQVLYQVWVFADMRGIPSLTNAAIDMCHERMAAA